MASYFPNPPDTLTGQAWSEQRRRRALYEGCWSQYAREAMARCVGAERASMFAQEPDLTKNIFRSVIIQLSILYDQRPILRRKDGNVDAIEQMTNILHSYGVWELMGTVQALTIAQRECALFVGVSEDTSGLVFRIVPADLCSATALCDYPDKPIEFSEYQIEKYDERDAWIRTCYDLQTNEITRTVAEGRTDTEQYAHSYGYSFAVDDDGTKHIPYVLYHAKRTGKLFDPWYGVELADGSLKASALWTFWGHVVFDASWPQRTGINVRLAAGGVAVDGAQSVVADPATVALFDPTNPGIPSSLQQWMPGGDPAVLGDAIRAYASDLAMDFEISPADIQRSNGDARSGYAIQLTREGQRAAQRRYESTFRRGDLQLLALIAMRAREIGISLPTDGWEIDYPGLPLSFEEKRAAREDEQSDLERGLISIVDVYLKRNPTVAREQAQQDIARIRAEIPVDASLSGDQIYGAIAILKAASLGEIERDAAVAMISMTLRIPLEEAAKMTSGANQTLIDSVLGGTNGRSTSDTTTQQQQ